MRSLYTAMKSSLEEPLDQLEESPCTATKIIIKFFQICIIKRNFTKFSLFLFQNAQNRVSSSFPNMKWPEFTSGIFYCGVRPDVVGAIDEQISKIQTITISFLVVFFFNYVKDKCSGTDVTRNGGCGSLKYRYKNITSNKTYQRHVSFWYNELRRAQHHFCGIFFPQMCNTSV